MKIIIKDQSIKVGILAGGLGSRLAEETSTRPKPMVEIGEMPILWHIMKMYSHFGFNDFSIALGYKGEYIKRWFRDFCSNQGSVSLNVRTGDLVRHSLNVLPEWNVDLVDTGMNSGTGGRIKQLGPWLGSNTMLVTWGDGVADINIPELLAFHRSHGRLATLTAVRPPARYGRLDIDGDQITKFSEKPQIGEGWINGAFFVLEQGVLDFIESDEEMFEQGPLSRLAEEGQLMAYHHRSFWQCMDTMREKQILTQLWQSGNAPWEIWKDEVDEGPADWTPGVHWDGPGAEASRVRA